MTALRVAPGRRALPFGVRFDRFELAGAFADVGVLVPIAVALIVKNGLSPTAVLLPAGLLYLVVAAVYRLPIAVQPLKAFGAIAIAQGLGADEIAAGALLMGLIFVGLGVTGLVDLAGRAFPRALVRGIQLTVGLLFLKIAWRLVAHPPSSFDEHGLGFGWAVALAGCVLLALLLRRRIPVALVLVGIGAAVMVATANGRFDLGPSSLALPSLDAAAFWTALTVLVLPQVPLTFANSCLAPADAARTYFGEGARRVRPGPLATTLGLANLVSGGVTGMPVCHGAGGLTAHYSHGARTAGAPLAAGATLLALALALGASLAGLLPGFPLPILAGLLAGAGLLHIGLLRDLRGVREWGIAAVVGAIGFGFNLAFGLLAGLALWWLPVLLARTRARATREQAPPLPPEADAAAELR
jgi:SulP family sulfate permease